MPMTDPWDEWYIYLREWLILVACRYTNPMGIL